MLPTTSPARIAANRANAALSTGPRTEEGKTRSRANSLKHGLTAEVIELDGVAARTSPVLDATGRLDPVWVEAEILRLTTQIDRGRRIERNLRAEAKFRAETHWGDDREVDAEALGAKLSRNPSLVVAQLRRCPYGCSWLITRWECLRLAATTNPEGWNEIQTKLAFDLLGIPAEVRDRPVIEAVACRRYPAEPATSQLAIAEEMLADLEERIGMVDESDNVARRLAEHDLVDLPTPELARIRRYETALMKQLFWLLDYKQTTRPIRPPVATQPPAPTEPTPPRNEANFRETKPTPPTPQPESALPTPASVSANNLRPTETTPNPHPDMPGTDLPRRSS